MKINILFWCLIILMAPSFYSQSTLTPGLIFDFNPGDEFHYSSSSFYNTTYYGGFKIKILNKTTSNANDSIYYGIRKDSWSQTSTQGTTQINDTIYSTIFDTLIYTHLDSNIKFLPEYNSASITYFEDTYNSYAAQDSFCLTTLSFFEDSATWTFGVNQFPSYFSSFSNSANTCNFGTSTYNTNRFSLGLGVVTKSYSYFNVSGTGSSFQLVYYIKDSVSVGTPDALLSVPSGLVENDFTLLPNPTIDQFTVKLNSYFHEMLYTIYNECGMIVLQGNLNSTHSTVDVTKLNSGVYFFKVDDQPLFKRLVIKK